MYVNYDATNLYVGGTFTSAGGAPAANVARWDGTRWRALGAGVDGGVHALVLDGQGDLIVGGTVTHAGGEAAARVARWDGVTWSPLGAGVDGFVGSLVLDACGDLIAAGDFRTAGGSPASRIAKWDGASWSAAFPGLTHDVWLLVLGVGDDVYAGGGNYPAGDPTWHSYVSHWDGTAWTTIHDCAYNMVRTLVIDANGELCMGGDFTSAGGVPALHVARWDGTAWSPLGAGLPGWVDCLVVDRNGRLCAVSGSWDSGGAGRMTVFAGWDGTVWSPRAAAIGDVADLLALDNDGRLLAAGNFVTAGDVLAGGLARWDGATWSSFGTGQGLNASVSALATDERGNVYAGGAFTVAGSVAAAHVARWDGAAWAALGAGFDKAVTALTCAPGGIVYAAGAFTTADGMPAVHVARWSGTAWTGLGPVVAGASVRALAMGSDGCVYAGGTFYPGTSAPYGVARWDGQVWSKVGAETWDDATVAALVTGPEGNLYAVGSFGDEYEPTHGVRKWDGAAWTAVGAWPQYSPTRVWCAAVDGSGRLYVGGIVYRNYSVNASAFLARWDGAAWSAVDGWTEPRGGTRSLAVDAHGHLVVGHAGYEHGSSTGRRRVDALASRLTEKRSLWPSTAAEPSPSAALRHGARGPATSAWCEPTAAPWRCHGRGMLSPPLRPPAHDGAFRAAGRRARAPGHPRRPRPSGPHAGRHGPARRFPRHRLGRPRCARQCGRLGHLLRPAGSRRTARDGAADAGQVARQGRRCSYSSKRARAWACPRQHRPSPARYRHWRTCAAPRPPAGRCCWCGSTNASLCDARIAVSRCASSPSCSTGRLSSAAWWDYALPGANPDNTDTSCRSAA
jgi:hypothetical protein